MIPDTGSNVKSLKVRLTTQWAGSPSHSTDLQIFVDRLVHHSYQALPTVALHIELTLVGIVSIVLPIHGRLAGQCDLYLCLETCV